ncbi:MAG: DUF2065 domain-containing protein [Hyphomicrobiaceae bacterium]
MSDLAVGIGLVLVIEGLIWAVAPRFGMELLAAAAATPPERLRGAGALAVAVGVGIVWLVRG